MRRELTPSSSDGRRVLDELSRRNINFADFLLRMYTILAAKTLRPFEDHLVELGVITSTQLSEVKTEGDNYRKNEFLYNIIRTKNAAAGCIVALETSENNHVIKAMIEMLDREERQSVQDCNKESSDVQQLSGVGNILQSVTKHPLSDFESPAMQVDIEGNNDNQPNLEHSESTESVQGEIDNDNQEVTERLVRTPVEPVPETRRKLKFTDVCGYTSVIVVLTCVLAGVIYKYKNNDQHHEIDEGMPKNMSKIIMTDFPPDLLPTTPVKPIPRPFALAIDSPLTPLPPNKAEIHLTIKTRASPKKSLLGAKLHDFGGKGHFFPIRATLYCQWAGCHLWHLVNMLGEALIKTQTKQSWNQWETPGAESVTSLSLKGVFSYNDIIYFLVKFKKLKKLELSWGIYLCESMEESNVEIGNDEVRVVSSITDLRISNIDESCKFLYLFLLKKINFPQLKALTLDSISIQIENREYIEQFFKVNGQKLEKMVLRNVTVLGNVNKALFASVSFLNLKEGKLQLNPHDSDFAVETLINFSAATSNISQFESNIMCVFSDKSELLENWKFLKDPSNVCDI